MLVAKSNPRPLWNSIRSPQQILTADEVPANNLGSFSTFFPALLGSTGVDDGGISGNLICSDATRNTPSSL